MPQPRIPEGGESQALALPPIPVEVARDLLQACDRGLEIALDRVYTMTESQLADTIEGGLQSATAALHQVLRDVPADEQGQRAMAQSYLDAAAETDIEGMEMGMLKVSGQELAEGVNTVRALLEELGEGLLSLSRDDIEEVADVALCASRVWLQLAQRAARRTLRALDGDKGSGRADGASEDKAAADSGGGAVVEEASEEEIADYYRKRGLEPPPPSATKPQAPTKPDVNEGPVPATTQGRYGRPPRPRVLWRPLAPQVVKLTKETLPHELRAHPFKMAGALACFLPVSGVVLFCLPGVLVTDHFVLQKLYARFGPALEEVVEDVRQVGRLGFVVTRLTVRQGYRVARRQMRKAQADPVQAVHDAGAWVWDVATHPVATAKAAVGVGKRAVEWTMKVGGFLCAEVTAGR